MKLGLDKRPQILTQYQKQIQKIQQLKAHRKCLVKQYQHHDPNLHKLLVNRQQNTVFHMPKVSSMNMKLKYNNEVRDPQTQRSHRENKLAIRVPNGNNFQRDRLDSIRNTERLLMKSRSNKRTLSVKEFLVEHDNIKLGQAIKSHQLDRKQYRKKLKTEVTQYKKLREHMQRFKSKNFNILFSTANRSSRDIEKRKEEKMGENVPKTTRQVKNPNQFRKFLTEAIEETKRRMSPEQVFTRE